MAHIDWLKLLFFTSGCFVGVQTFLSVFDLIDTVGPAYRETDDLFHSLGDAKVQADAITATANWRRLRRGVGGGAGETPTADILAVVEKKRREVALEELLKAKGDETDVPKAEDIQLDPLPNEKARDIFKLGKLGKVNWRIRLFSTTAQILTMTGTLIGLFMAILTAGTNIAQLVSLYVVFIGSFLTMAIGEVFDNYMIYEGMVLPKVAGLTDFTNLMAGFGAMLFSFLALYKHELGITTTELGPPKSRRTTLANVEYELGKVDISTTGDNVDEQKGLLSDKVGRPSSTNRGPSLVRNRLPSGQMTGVDLATSRISQTAKFTTGNITRESDTSDSEEMDSAGSDPSGAENKEKRKEKKKDKEHKKKDKPAGDQNKEHKGDHKDKEHKDKDKHGGGGHHEHKEQHDRKSARGANKVLSTTPVVDSPNVMSFQNARGPSTGTAQSTDALIMQGNLNVGAGAAEFEL
ncbi:unnamed protein product [Amoebophrya sp. A120]|nr:unnamed protein product [Amoebophrya sp. A120]|eukprot:GSA120T00017863001.1